MNIIKTLFVSLILTGVFASNTMAWNPVSASDLNPENFKSKVEGKETALYTLKNGSLHMTVTNYGGRIVSLHVPDKDGNLADVVLGFNSIEEYLKATEPYHGALIGRVGNRIAEGQFQLNETTYNLPLNNGPNHLHGGPKGF
ncbi:MAG: galactose-1-epimerase, partial [Bacteroidales bacterium]|nr:galactose-1-epimerase [Bacteroidales bacterium]